MLDTGRLSPESGFPAGLWELLGGYAACQMDQYLYRASTRADSTGPGEGESVFMVSAHTTIPSAWYASDPATGWSVDNLAPGIPEGLHFVPPGELIWDEAVEGDFKYFTVYGSAGSIWNESAVVIGYAVTPTEDVSGAPYAYYHVTATDFAGNEGPATSVRAASTADEVFADTYGLCLSTIHPCVMVPVEFVRDDTSPARAISVRLQLSPELALCEPDPEDVALNFHRGSWLDGYDLVFDVVAEGGGIYTVDQSILGTPCGVTDGGTLFTVDVAAAPGADPDDVGTITVLAVDVRDCGNPFSSLPGEPGDPATLTIDRTGPVVMSDLSAAQLKSGNDVDGTTKITLTWPAAESGATVELFRKGFGHYPEYDDDGGAAPSAPADPAAALLAGWTSLGTQVSPYADETNSERDYYYYVAFVTDACGNVSAVSNRTNGTLNYHLGDNPASGMPPPFGDNEVEFVDVSFLGDHYGTAPPNPLYENMLDIGPTTDNSTNGRPTTDNRIQFEDLIILSINYGMVNKSLPAPTGAEHNAVALNVGPGADGIEAVATLSSTGAVQGVSLPLRWNAEAVEPIAYRSGELVNRQSGRALVLCPEPGTVDAAVFGSTFAGTGELAVITFRVIGSGDPGIRFGEVIARDGENHPVAMETTVATRDLPVTPTMTRLLPSAPNPFLGSTQIRFALSEPGEGTVRVYALDGRLVRTLVDAALPMGEKSVTWDGRDEMGRSVAAGTYIVQFRAGNVSEAQRVMRLR